MTRGGLLHPQTVDNWLHRYVRIANSLILVALTVARSDHHKDSVALPIDAQQRLPLRLSRQAVKVCHGIHRVAIDSLDDIAWL
jgi:hypothetical protein